MAERLLPGLERRLKAEVAGGVDFGRFTRGRYATDASHYQIMPLGVVTPRTIDEAERAIGICRARGRAGDGARRRFVAVRADGEPFGHRRLLEASQPRARSRRGGPPRAGRARHRAGRSEPGAEAARAVVSGRCVDRVARHHRRHDGEQLLRRPVAALRQHPRERHRHRRAAGRRRQGAFRPGGAGPVRSAGGIRRCVRWRAICSRWARARPTRSRRVFPRCSAESAATTSTRWCRGGTTSTSRISWSARRARSRSRPRSRSSCRRCSASVRSAPATSAASTRRWRRRSTSSSSAPSRSSWSMRR